MPTLQQYAPTRFLPDGACRHRDVRAFFAHHHAGFAADLYYELFLDGVSATDVDELVRQGAIRAAAWPRRNPETIFYWDRTPSVDLEALARSAVALVRASRRVHAATFLDRGDDRLLAGLIYARERHEVLEIDDADGLRYEAPP